MHNIEITNFGFRLTFGGFIELEEMKQWAAESEEALLRMPASFYVFVDMRELKPMAPETQECMRKTQGLYKIKGMKRSVVIVNNFLTQHQFKRIAKESGIYEWERYIDASQTPDWDIVGLSWLLNGIDPDLKKA